MDKEHNHSDNHGNHNHKDHHKMMIDDFKKRFYIVLVLTIPILILSPTVQDWISLTFSFPGDAYLLMGLSTIAFFYGGWPFLKGSYKEIFKETIGMMTLIALALTVAYVYSSATILGLEGKDFFWELVTLILIMLLGHWIEMKSVVSASSALDELAKLIPDDTHRVTDDRTEDVLTSEIEEDDIVLVKPSERIPLDGVIVEGNSHIDESVLTGESQPVHKDVGDEVIAGAINGNKAIKVKITHKSGDSYVSNVIKIVEEAQSSKSKTQNFTDKAAFYLTVVAISVGIGTLITWFIITGDLAFSITRMATVMIITCPHALGLAIPLVVANSTTLAAKNGLIIRNRTAFENSRNITAMVFDKTGTLTEGEFAISEYNTLNDKQSKEDILIIAGSLEHASEHSIAQAFMKAIDDADLDQRDVKDFEIIQGKGVKGKIDGTLYYVVSKNYLQELDLTLPEDVSIESTGTQSFLVTEDSVLGYFVLKDQLRESSKESIQTLKDRGIECWMLTGDNEAVAKEVAEELDLDGYFAEVLPDQKQDKIKSLQDDDYIVAMTGDGVNDAPALAQADIGIAVGSGTDVAVETADIILANSDPKDIVDLQYFGTKTYQKMIQNLIWATAYNVIAIPLAAGVLYNQGILIPPSVGAVVMSLSTVVVAINAKLLSFDRS
ncbi:MAG: copper-translocating P-type ATPase [Candidatus Izemoplasma sp.]|nr:copper-translocating P-type ATPase [Candidatus Izemoplasma sp.]